VATILSDFGQLLGSARLSGCGTLHAAEGAGADQIALDVSIQLGGFLGIEKS